MNLTCADLGVGRGLCRLSALLVMNRGRHSIRYYFEMMSVTTKGGL